MADRIHRFPAKMALGLAEHYFDQIALPAFGATTGEGLRFYDPFCGSGTTLLVARARGFEVMGSDLLDSSTLLSRAKVTRLSAGSLRRLRSELNSNPLSYRTSPRWTWKSWSTWYQPSTLRALQDLDVHVESKHKSPYFAHLWVALSQTCWDVSGADPTVMVPTHSKLARGVPRVLPGEVLATYRSRLTRVLAAQGALGRLGISTAGIGVWKGDATAEKTWPANKVDVLLSSPPYGLGIDYVRAASLQSRALAIRDESAASRSEMMGRLGHLNEVEELPRRFAREAWYRSLKSRDRLRFQALLQYFADLREFLVACAAHVSGDGTIGVVLGDPEMGRQRVPLTSIAEHLAGSVGLSSLMPPVTDRIRRRFQASRRRSSTDPILHETLLTFQPN
ncbi:MAG: hypothetical protein L3K16_08285 [Thermoplasmata archaeon]|nr:hypothetical protein [Thermoplasmata archaeon]